jgi:hypothetical protein
MLPEDDTSVAIQQSLCLCAVLHTNSEFSSQLTVEYYVLCSENGVDMIHKMIVTNQVKM